MPDKLQGAITSDKVETDNTNFATVKADQTCEEALVPRENAFRQLNWQVTLEKGSVYNPPEAIGIYAAEVDCKYGVQVSGDIFGRDRVAIEHGGAAHPAANEASTLGARIAGSVISKGQIDIVAPASTFDDWEAQPVAIYGDLIGAHITVERPTVVYGSVHATDAFRTNARTVILGDVYSEGDIEASDLFAFSVSAAGDITLGANVAVVNPTIRSMTGSIRIADCVGLLTPHLFEHIKSNSNIDAVGLWVFDIDAVWEQGLYSVDITDAGDGKVADRAWRTVNELPDDHYAAIRNMFEDAIESTRKDPPSIGEFRYAGITSLDELGGDTTIDGDVVVGSQDKTVDTTEIAAVDQSITEIDQSTEVNDESTEVSDSVINRSDVDDNTNE